MKHKTSELTGALLDAAVALAEGRLVLTDEPGWQKGDLKRLRKEYGGGHVVRWYATENGEPDGKVTGLGGWEPLDNQGSPSTDWRIGGPIIDNHLIAVGYDYLRMQWVAACNDSRAQPVTATHFRSALIAAMRAYVASRFGDEVDL